MRYDADGRRVERKTRPNGGAETTVTFRYQGDAIAQELTGTTPVLARTYVTDEAGAIVKVCDPDCTGSNPQYLVTWSGHGDAWELLVCSAPSMIVSCILAYTANKWASAKARQHFPGVSIGRATRANAFRHCCWTALVSWQVGPINAKIIADAYERSDSIQSAFERRMDDHDNSVGIHLGRSNRSHARSLSACQDAVRRGVLIWSGQGRDHR